MPEILLNNARSFILNSVRMQQRAVKEGRACSVLYLSGKPGIGKSDLLSQICTENQFGLIVKYMGTMLVEQITGLPRVHDAVDGGAVQWSLPELFSLRNFRVPPANETLSDGPIPKVKQGPVIIFLDDAHLCNKTIQSYMFQLLSYRSVHDHKLPDNCVIILAGNRSTDRAGFQPILAPITNRIFFLDVKSEVEDWVNNFAIPYQVRDDIVHFLMLHNDCLQSEPLESLPWASPRSWTYASDSLKEFEENNPGRLASDEGIVDMLSLVAGHVGQDYASKYIEYIKIIRRWPATAILNGNLPLPKVEGRIENYALASSLILEFQRLTRDFGNTSSTEIIKKFSFQLNILREMFINLTKTCKEIAPYAAKSLIFSSKQSFVTTAIIQTVWQGNDELVKAIQGMLKDK